MGFNLGKELNKLKEFAIDAAPYAMMAAPFIPGVNPGVMSLMEKHAPWMKTAMQSKFMNSVMGASVKDALMSYTMAKMQGKRNPHLIAKNALMRNMFINANKVGWDMDMMMGGDPTTLPALADRVVDPVDAVMAEHDTTFTPNIDYAMPHPSASYEMVKNLNVNPNYPYPNMTPGYTGGINEEALKDQISQIQDPTMYTQIPAMEGYNIPGEDIQAPLDKLAMAYLKNPLAGMGFLTTTKTKPSWMDKLLKRSEEAKDLGITAGTDAYDEFYGIGETRPDVAKMIGLGYDFFVDPRTEAQIERDEQEEFERKMARLMYPRSMADVPDFQSAFLGNKGGIASLSNGGMGPGPYSNPYPDDDPNVDVQDIIQGPGFESIDELGSLFGEEEMASAPHPMEGWYDMFFDTFGRYPNNEAELIQFINEADVDVPAVAQGGRIGMYGGGDLNAIPGGMVSGPGTETSDSIPAQLSNNEFVVTADAVRAAGGGDIDVGAEKFYGIMNALDPNSAKLGEPPVYS